jgi:hypothetical protein
LEIWGKVEMKESLVVLVLGLAACNYDVGECYPRREGSGNAGAGGGVVLPGPGGVGGFGNVPLEPQNAQEPVDCSDTAESPPENDGSDEAGLKVFCLKKDHGATCSAWCMDKGIGCVALALHPLKSDGEIGKLFACNDLSFGFMCGYHYPSGDDCYYPFGLPFPKHCSYSGND